MASKRKKTKRKTHNGVLLGASNSINRWKGGKAGSTNWEWKSGVTSPKSKRIAEILKTPLASNFVAEPSELTGVKKLTSCPFCGDRLEKAGALSRHLKQRPACRKSVGKRP